MGDEEGGPNASKKRVAGRQICKDNPESDDDTPEPEMGTFKKASEEVMATRKIVKVKRNQPTAAVSSNPFAGICLVPPQATNPSPQSQTYGDVTATKQNNIPDTSQENKESEVKSIVSAVEEKEPIGNKLDTAPNSSSSRNADEVKNEITIPETSQENKESEVKFIVSAVEEKEPIATELDTVPNSSSSRNADEVKNELTDVKTLPAEAAEDEQEETLTEPKPEAVGSGEKDAENKDEDESEKEKLDKKQDNKAVPAGSFGSFKQLSSGQNAFTGFSGTGFSTSSFGFGSFATGASTLGASSGSLFGFNSVNTSESINGNSSSEPLNSSADSTKNFKPTLQAVHVETGEENEKAIFTADAILYEYLEGVWKERGKGELKLNLSEKDAGKARLVMRARGNYRLSLNASLYPDMLLTSMEKKGVTFACVNSAGEVNHGLATFALKFKDSSFVEEFRKLVMIHKGKSGEETSANLPEGADEQV